MGTLQKFVEFAEKLDQDWATDDGSGFSKEWFPSTAQMETIKKDFVPEREYICTVKNPSGKVSVFTTYEKSGHWILVYQLENNTLTFLEDEVLVVIHQFHSLRVAAFLTIYLI